MNAFLKKEIRLLLPSFLIGCVMTVSTWLSPWRNHDAIRDILSLLPFVACPAVVVMMVLNSFGVEISSGTFTNLLAQPISRLKIWETKISLLAVALLVVGILWLGSIFCVRIFSSYNNSMDPHNLFVAAVMFALVVFSGGLWTVLLLRQVAAAFWFTLLVPGVCMGIVAGLFADYSGEFMEGMMVSVLGLYSLAGFFFARWLFLRAQDVQWSGGTIVMPKMRGLPTWLSNTISLRLLRPRAALWRKEFQLHQAQFIMAFALLLLHLGVMALRTFGHFEKRSTTEYILESFWMLWLVMPVLVGCAAVAEERKLGTLESQLCLPVKRRTQFAIKFLVALILSVLLGAIVPMLLEGTKILPKFDLNFAWDLMHGKVAATGILEQFALNALIVILSSLPSLMLAGIAAAFGVISFYVSSLTHNTLQSLAPAMLGILLAFFGVIVVEEMRAFDLDFLWHGSLPFFVGVPVLLVTLLALTFRNFQHARTGWRMWRQNFFTLVLALLFSAIATSAIYHRVWENLTPFEPPHDATRFSQTNPASLNTRGGEISVRLPDGKIWMSYFMANENSLNPISRLLGNVKADITDGKFISGTNWLSMQRSFRELIGLKTDGSLWVSEGLQGKGHFLNGKWTINQDKMQHLVPFGNETNWNSFAPIYTSALLVKNDGTLWRWGVTNFDFKQHEWPGLRTFTPYRLGTESNWAKIYEIADNSDRMYLRKTDGSIWTWGSSDWTTNGETRLELEPDFTLQSVKNLERERFRSVAQISHGLQYKVGVRDDGTFRIWADERLEFKKHYENYAWFPTDLQIGNETNWVAVAGGGEKIVTLKNDGSLWLWNFHRPQREEWITGSWTREYVERQIQNTRPTRLGTHSDWIAISGDWGSVTALAADGSLWFWPLERSDYYYNDDANNNGSHLKPLLDMSRKPQRLGNVFGKAN